MKKSDSGVFDIFVRYFIIIIFGLGNLFILYKIFTPLTLVLLYFILNIFGDPQIIGNIIFIGLNSIEIVPACVAGAAYYFLFVLAMSCRINFKTRIKAIGIVLGGFFVLNIIRLSVLSFLVDSSSFDVLHWISWHFLSAIIVFGLWIFAIKILNIKSVPVYDDFRYLLKLTKKPKRKKKKN